LENVSDITNISNSWENIFEGWKSKSIAMKYLTHYPLDARWISWEVLMSCKKTFFNGVHPILTSTTTKETHFIFESISTHGYDPGELVDLSQ